MTIYEEFKKASATLDIYQMYLWIAKHFIQLREAGINIHPSHARTASKVQQNEWRVEYLGHKHDNS